MNIELKVLNEYSRIRENLAVDLTEVLPSDTNLKFIKFDILKYLTRLVDIKIKNNLDFTVNHLHIIGNEPIIVLNKRLNKEDGYITLNPMKKVTNFNNW